MSQGFIELVQDVELAMADLYSFFSELFPQDRPFWQQMSQEEHGHARLVVAFADQFRQGASGTVDNAAFAQRMINFIQHIRTYIAEHRQTGVERADAFNLALQIERAAWEVHFHKTFAQLQSVGNSDLFTRLQELDRLHVEKLRRYIEDNP